jgi:uncharacterized protein with NAD-binding domain and iron-sulfur cluster
MAKIVIVGAGVVGLGAGLLLCGDGHEVVVLERDAGAPPAGAEEIWGTWRRQGVIQFRLPHFFLARYSGLLDAELPEVTKALAAAGAVRRNPVLDAPEALRGPAREEDGMFGCITGRRCVVEAAVASAALGGRQSGSQRTQPSGDAGRRPATFTSGERHIRRRRATSGDWAGLI